MASIIDITFSFYSDTPLGKDPDQYSPTLKSYHKLLWSKPLPFGEIFHLSDSVPGAYLHHSSAKGEFYLRSDAITHSYRNVRKLARVIDGVPKQDVDDLFNKGSTIGAYVIFPSKKVDNKMTINGARGFNHKIADRFDLTLECIRRYYQSGNSPLQDTLIRYTPFFELFRDFKGYVDFFLLNDLVTQDYQAIKFHLPFHQFESSPLPKNGEEYLNYKENVLKFIQSRGRRIQAQTQAPLY